MSLPQPPIFSQQLGLSPSALTQIIRLRKVKYKCDDICMLPRANAGPEHVFDSITGFANALRKAASDISLELPILRNHEPDAVRDIESRISAGIRQTNFAVHESWYGALCQQLSDENPSYPFWSKISQKKTVALLEEVKTYAANISKTAELLLHASGEIKEELKALGPKIKRGDWQRMVKQEHERDVEALTQIMDKIEDFTHRLDKHIELVTGGHESYRNKAPAER